VEVGQTVSDRDARAFLLGAGAERPALDGQLLLGERVAGWLLAPPEAGLDRADRIVWTARRVAAGLDLSIDSYEEPTLTVLANERRAFVMLLRYYGDAGMHAGDPGAEGDEEPERFTLANGQVDEFPREWTVTHAQAMASVRAFLETRTLGSGVRRIQS
jgi:Immunity protein Imm1